MVTHMNTMEMSDRVRAEIRGALGAAGMTQKALAMRLRWKTDHLNYIMRYPSTIKVNELEDICEALNMTITFGKGKK